MTPNKIVVFESKKIRRIWHNEEWFFSVVDACGALTESPDAGAYWRKLKQRLNQEGSEVVTICHGLKLEAADGKKYMTDCANTKGLFRIIQSIPSPKAEPFKRWLAQVGFERVQEIENPELAQQRMKELYEFLKISGRELLDHAGIISAETAKLKAEKEYDQYHSFIDSQPRPVDEDFELAVKKLQKKAKSKKLK